ncbi:MAG: 1-(5-phosphoribosyl)-5-[(5-phosphoribosylamino)methylideneamino]imidazole-4-carboxamide isomerase [Ruminococcaceae bacterium]|nr:1-(5-phosphoribosyl)-5-[(5-phosphoribosylamino)methylideneamino]imidazole-4-carboxamide isomerase [Oscillospiraceae bacterium]
MKIFPAIDLFEGKVVRLFKGDYAQMTVYSEDPLAVARDFEAAGATCLHLVDLEGAKSGDTPNLDTVKHLAENTALFTEIGGGIRSLETVDAYLSVGVDRVILGTAAVCDPAFLRAALAKHGERIAVGVDIRDGKVAIKGWTETAEKDAMDFCRELETLGVRTVICTDISRDGAMQGTNHALYRTMSEELSLDIVASGGVSSLADVEKLAETGLYGAIIGKAYYTGAIDLRRAIEVAI